MNRIEHRQHKWEFSFVEYSCDIKKDKLPLTIQFHGAGHTVVSPAQSDEMVARLKEIGADVTYTRIDGVAHDVWDYVYNKEIVDWMLSKKTQSFI